MTKPDLEMTNLNAHLAQASKAGALIPDETFMARMMQDALAHQPMPAVARVAWWKQAASALGGWQGLGGLVAATCVGFWFGVSPPDMLPTSLEGLLNIDVASAEGDGTDGLLGFGWNLEEG